MKVSKEDKERLLKRINEVEKQLEEIPSLVSNIKFDIKQLKKTLQETNDYDKIENDIISLHVQISQFSEIYLEFETGDII